MLPHSHFRRLIEVSKTPLVRATFPSLFAPGRVAESDIIVNANFDILPNLFPPFGRHHSFFWERDFNLFASTKVVDCIPRKIPCSLNWISPLDHFSTRSSHASAHESSQAVGHCSHATTHIRPSRHRCYRGPYQSLPLRLWSITKERRTLGTRHWEFIGVHVPLHLLWNQLDGCTASCTESRFQRKRMFRMYQAILLGVELEDVSRCVHGVRRPRYRNRIRGRCLGSLSAKGQR